MTGDTGSAGTRSASAGSASRGSASTASTGQVAAALQSALAAENAAVYGYGVAGGQLGSAARKLALQNWTQHEMARDRLQAMLTSLGVKPVAAQAAYQMPFPVHGTRAAISLAGYLENQVAAAYLGVVALDDPRLRAWGAGQAQACALRATTWLGRTTAFPGLASGPAASAPPTASS